MTKPIRTKPVPYCPECGAQMELRRPDKRRLFNEFWGCSQYPKCKGTRYIGSDGKPERDAP